MTITASWRRAHRSAAATSTDSTYPWPELVNVRAPPGTQAGSKGAGSGAVT